MYRWGRKKTPLLKIYLISPVYFFAREGTTYIERHGSLSGNFFFYGGFRMKKHKMYRRSGKRLNWFVDPESGVELSRRLRTLHRAFKKRLRSKKGGE